QSLRDSRLNRSAASLDLANEHRALNRRDAKICHLLLVRIFGKPPPSLLPDEEGGDPAPYDLEDEAEILPNEFVVSAKLVSDGAKRTAPSHSKAPLQVQVSREPLF